MARIELLRPTENFLPDILAYKRAFASQNLLIHGSQGLDNFSEDELVDWLDYLNAPAGTNRFGYETVSSATWLAWHRERQEMVGIINLRYHLNDYLLKIGGHIGYSIHPDFWNQGYGTEMLALVLKECEQAGIRQVLITCEKNNIASAKVIINNGGILENELLDNDRIVQRYWITL